MSYAYQASLFDGDYQPDIWVPGKKTATALHYDHSVAAMRRPFIGWDGEGYTDEFGQHHYWLLANSCGSKLIAPPGRSLERHNVARFFTEVGSEYPDAIHGGFALGYDYTCILRGNGLTPTQFDTLYRKNYLVDQGFNYRVMMGKTLTVYPNGWGENNGKRFLMQDSWGFFQSSFVKALDSYFGTTWPYRDTIIEMKQLRSQFTRDEDENVMMYNDMELELWVILMEELRDRLFQAGMPISRWYGPGALANGLLSRWKIKNTLINLYQDKPEIAQASQYGYSGGRFELLKPGHTNAPVYQYDINSAYPWAIAQLPNLATGNWEYRKECSIDDLTPFSVAHIRWDSNIPYWVTDNAESVGRIFPESIPFPFWRRSPQGRISYPSYGIEGWFWQPEIAAARDYSSVLAEQFGITTEIEIDEAWIFHGDNSLPFTQIPRLYQTRQELKAKGNGAHVGIKLGLNSLYGKLAQQIGWNPDQPDKFPAYHNMALAGWVTAACRAKLLSAILRNPAAIIATETDAVFSLEPLDLPISTNLGEWEETVYDDMWYFASGFRFGLRGGEVVKPATRGIPVKDINLDAILASITQSDSTLKVTQTQFMTLNWAVAMNRLKDVGNWREVPKELRLMCEDPVGKRIHDWNCPSCSVDNEGIRVYNWNQSHLTVPNPSGAYEMSAPHDIIWMREAKSKPIEPDTNEGEMIFLYDE